MPEMLPTSGARPAMMRPMTQESGSFSRSDIALTAFFSLFGLLLMYGNTTDPEVNGPALGVPAFLAVTLPVLWRRARPLLASGAVLAALLVHIALFGTLIRCGVIFPLTWVLIFSAAARLELAPSLAALGLGLTSQVVMTLSDQMIGVQDVPFFAPLTVAAWGLGRVVRSRARLAAELQAHTVELRGARDRRARLEVATDRARLSGELDELLQRRLGELAVLADRGRAGADPQAATATLVDIEHRSRQTLEEMRELVGVLRDDDGGASVAPQPTLTHLEALLVRARGAEARLTVSGSPRALPAGVELSAYRVVEHVLDALDEAPGVDVEVRFADDALELAVAGHGWRRSGAAAALERARERVDLHRGTFRSEVHAGRAEAIAQLPLLGGT
jgi:hypothetical protein